MKVEMDMYKEIRQNYVEGESQRQIAQRLGIYRQTVKKYCEGAAHPDVRKSYERAPDTITSDVKQFILDCFELDKKENIIKQKHTAKRIFDRLVKEKLSQVQNLPFVKL